VADDDAGDSLALKVEDQVQEMAGVFIIESRRGFVQDQKLDFLGQGLGDLNQLLLAHADVLDRGNRIFGQPHPGQQLCGLQVGLTPIHPAIFGLFVTEVDVLGDGEVGAQCELLVDDDNAALFAVIDGGEVAGFVFEEDVPFEGAVRVDTGQDLHEGGFPGPVLTTDGVYLAAVNIQGDILQRLDARKGLGDSSHLKNGCIHRQFPLTGRKLGWPAAAGAL
jgi:hypothetical protein